MAEKTTTKTVKKTVAKKAPVKKSTTKKAPEKKVMAHVVETHKCGCDNSCPCGGECKCHKHHCGFWKKLIVVLVFFGLGFAAAQMIPCKKHHKMPRPQFDDNGCLVVKCQKMIEKMAEIDTNADNCVDKAEFKEFMSKMHKPKIAE